MIKDLLANIVNKKDEDQILYTGIVSSVSPLQVKFYPSDDAINVKSLILSDLIVGSNVLMLKFLSKFIIIGVIGDLLQKQNAIEIITISSSEYFSNTTKTNTNLVISFEASSTYHFELSLGASGDSSAGISLDWEVTSGSIPSNQTRKCLGMAFGETDRDSANFRANQSYLTTDVSYGIESNVNFIREEGILTTTTAGTLTLRASKHVNTGTDTGISSGSYLKVTKIS